MKNQTYRMTMLFDFYGELLTDRQKEFFDLYYNEDLSLSEIAENEGISRQGVRDVIVRAEAAMQEIEDKTGLIRRFEQFRGHLDAIRSAAEDIRTLNYRQYEDSRLTELTDKITAEVSALKEYPMAFEGLSEKLNAAFKRLRGKGRLTENDVREAMREVRLALLEADVSYKVVKEFVATVTERSVGTDVLDSLTPAQQVVKIVNEELTNLMGGGTAKLAFANNGPTIVMMVGLQGAGKTTTTAKLAGYMKKFHSKRPLLAACDVYRPAAIEQLKVVGGQLGLPVFEEGQGDPVKIAENALRYARDHGNDLVFLDTAGRLHVDEALMDELKRMKATVHPNEILLVVDAMTGQDAVNAASAFDEALGIDGVVLTKLDGDARGGAALSIKAATGKPIKFVGTGEKLDMIEPFHPDRMASRILGMGDMLSFIEKAQQTYDEKQAKKLEEKLKKNSFTLSDYFDQLQQIRNMGDLSQLAGMMPGNLGNKLQGAQIDEKAIAHTEAIILSMTPEERENPQILGASRKKRIAAGCGLDVVDVNRLLKQFEGMQQIIKQVTGGRKPGFGFGGLGHGRGLRKRKKK